MANKHLPKKITQGITLVACKISKDGKSFIPTCTPLSKSELAAQKNKKWTEEEDAMLLEIAMRTKKWNLIATEINQAYHGGVLIRNQKHCRERWKNFVDPDLKKKPFSQKEDEEIIKYYELYKSWAKVAKKIKNRNENQIKNRYRALMNKAVKDYSADLSSNLNNFSGFGFDALANYLTPVGSAIIPSFSIDQAVSECSSFGFQGNLFGNSVSTQAATNNMTNSFFRDTNGMYFPYNENLNITKCENILDRFCDVELNRLEY